MKLPILPGAEKLELILSTPPEIAKKVQLPYDEYKVDHGLSNEP